MNPTVSFEELKSYFIEVLREYVQEPDPNGLRIRNIHIMPDRSDIQIAGIESRVARKAFGERTQLDTAGKVEVRRLIWSLIFQGKLVPGTDTENSLPWLTITPEGEHWLLDDSDQNRSIFFSHEQYLARLDSQGVKLGEIAKSYVSEAINSYFNGCPRASMVMIGVAMEALFDELHKAICNTNEDGWNNIELASPNRSYSQRIDKFQKVIEPRYREVSGITGVENPQLYLTPMLDHVRQIRNDGAHAILPNHDQNEAFAMLEIFTRTSKIMCKLRDFLTD